MIDKSLLEALPESVQEMDAIKRGKRKPARSRVVQAPVEVKSIRARTRLSQGGQRQRAREVCGSSQFRHAVRRSIAAWARRHGRSMGGNDTLRPDPWQEKDHAY